MNSLLIVPGSIFSDSSRAWIFLFSISLLQEILTFFFFKHNHFNFVLGKRNEIKKVKKNLFVPVYQLMKEETIDYLAPNYIYIPYQVK